MLKGVNRCIIEIKNTDSQFFERVICFVRPEYCEEGFPKLHHSAENYVKTIDEISNPNKGGRFARVMRWILPIAAIGIGIVIGSLINR